MCDVGCVMCDVGCVMCDVGCVMCDVGCLMWDVGKAYANELPHGPPWRGLRFSTDLLSLYLLLGGGSFLTGGEVWLATREGENCENKLPTVH